ncbi:hypothetical protein ABFA07_007126 [Porites harrisoni]
MVVHCNSGTGRTGVFIAVDSTLQRIAAEKTIDVFGYVMSLRCDRNLIVQTEEQYAFIHEVLVEAIHGYTKISASKSSGRKSMQIQGKQKWTRSLPV